MNDGEHERNNDRNLLRRRENINQQQQAERDDPPLSRPVPNQREDRNNRNKQNEARTVSSGASNKVFK